MAARPWYQPERGRRPVPEKSIAERIDRLERAVVELDGHPAMYRHGQTRPALREIIADLDERDRQAKATKATAVAKSARTGR